MAEPRLMPRIVIAAGAALALAATPAEAQVPSSDVFLVPLAQRLWAFRMDGSAPELVLPDVKPVGYHAWIEGGGLALFVLGTPATVQIVAGPNAAPHRVAANAGRGSTSRPTPSTRWPRRRGTTSSPGMTERCSPGT